MATNFNRKSGLVLFLFWGIFMLLFIMMNFAFYYFLNISLNIFTVLYVCLLEMAALGFSYEITQLILALSFKPFILPSLKELENYPPVALLCTTCDNVNTDILKKLSRQTYKNLHIFILDDSRQDKSKLDVDSLGFHVVRRSNQIGYKAGNLNNWLHKYGNNFPYFIVADADSILPDDFTEQIISYAEHPDNARVAIFETLVSPWNHSNLFANLLGTMAPVVQQLKLRLENRFFSNFSVGHNNLYRTSIIKEIGGFPEDYLAEDYAISLEVFRKQYSCMTVPIKSYERLPENVREFASRQSRWTIQTFQLMSLKITKLSCYTCLNILMSLHYYLMPAIALLGMFMLASFNIKNFIYFHFSFPTSLDVVSLLIQDKTFFFWITYLLFPILLRGIFALRVGISFRRCLLNNLFQTALFFCSLWPIIHRLIAFRDDKRLHFNVTKCVPCPSVWQIILMNLPMFILIWITSLTIILNPIWSGLNLFWAIPASMSPFLINFIQRRKCYGYRKEI